MVQCPGMYTEWAACSIAGDFFRSVLSAPQVLPDILPAFVPYALVVAGFAGFVAWNGGIVLGEKHSSVGPFRKLTW